MNEPSEQFRNRQKEIGYLHRWLASEPNALLFVYGPKSSGKSTLIARVLEELDTRRFVINYLDLRGVLLYDFSSFLSTFFRKSPSDKVRGLIEGLSINTEEALPLVKKVHDDFLEQGFAQVNHYGKSLNAIIPLMVAHDFWFFRTDKQQLTANSESIRQAIQELHQRD